MNVLHVYWLVSWTLVLMFAVYAWWSVYHKGD